MPEAIPPDLHLLFQRFEPLPERIARNRRRGALFLAGYVTLSSLLVAMALVGGAYLTVLLIASRMRDPEFFVFLAEFTVRLPLIVLVLWVACLPVFLLWSLRALHTGDLPLLFGLNATGCAAGEYPQAHAALSDVAIASGTPQPQLVAIRDDALNAFVVCSGSSEAGWVGVTSGLAERLSQDELRFVFAHLVARIQDGSAENASVLARLFASASGAGRSGDSLFEACGADVNDGVVASVAKSIISPLTAWYGLTRMCLLLTKPILAIGYREQQLLDAQYADAAGLMFTKDPAGMMSALKKVLPADNRPGGISESRIHEDVYGALFFAWPTFSFADDPELVRITRMREVLGAAGV